MLTTFDWVVIVVYLVGVAAFGIRAGGRQLTAEDYFLGSRDLPWWAVCFSVVATETSTLTVIGIPAVSFLGTMTFFQITLGYLAGRIIVGALFLPRYFAGNLSTAYAFLGQRFGDRLRAATSVTFMATRLLADGVRLFATAIPLRVIALSVGLEVDYWQIIVLIGIVTIIYTYIGGIKAVVWMDVVQMGVYMGGAAIALVLLLGDLPAGWWAEASAAGKTAVFDFGMGQSLGSWLTQPYTFVTAVVGGAIFSMASHGTDQLIVQRLLTCRTLDDSRRALVVSALVVMVQFGLFLVIGLLLWVYYEGASLADLGLSRGDEIFPMFIIEGLPAGLSGLILAGILAAAMSTLSSSLNSLASSSVLDLYERFSRTRPDPARLLRISRVATLGWGVVFMGFATLFQDQENPVVELGLSIASFTYGGLLGVFLLGLWNRRIRETAALIAFVLTIITMVLVIFGVWYSGVEESWRLILGPSEELRQVLELRALAWPWYTAVGAALTLALGALFTAFDRHEQHGPGVKDTESGNTGTA